MHMEINSLNQYLRTRFGRKIYKLSLNANMTCPNRDGTIDYRGCIFCSAGGSGDFAGDKTLSVTEQIEHGKTLVAQKIAITDNEPCFIAYFQAYTNTYAPVDRLRKIYMEAANNPEIAAISIATRPDCINREIMELIIEIHKIKPVFIELGLQTCHKDTVAYIRRGYDNEIFEQTINLIDSYNAVIDDKSKHIHIVVHTIIGLPGESSEHMEATIRYINTFPIHGIKLQLLHVLKETDLAKEYEKNQFKVLSLEEYADILIKLLLIIRPDIVIHRLTGDGPKKLLIEPQWSGDKKHVLNYINDRLRHMKYNQGHLYVPETNLRKEESQCH